VGRRTRAVVLMMRVLELLGGAQDSRVRLVSMFANAWGLHCGIFWNEALKSARMRMGGREEW
jgi:hypothetical protein